GGRQAGEGHRERVRRGPRVALAVGHVVDGQGGNAVVVGDGAQALVVADGGVRRVRQVDGERLVALERRVAVDQDRDGLRGLAGGERQRVAVRRVVAGRRGGPVRGGVVHGGGDFGGPGLGDREGEAGGAGVAFRRGHIVDGQGR